MTNFLSLRQRKRKKKKNLSSVDREFTTDQLHELHWLTHRRISFQNAELHKISFIYPLQNTKDKQEKHVCNTMHH